MPPQSSCFTERAPKLSMFRCVLIGLIWMYRVSLAWVLGGRCRFYPSCSQYAEQALHTGGIGAREHGGEIRLEFRVVEVGVGVGEQGRGCGYSIGRAPISCKRTWLEKMRNRGFHGWPRMGLYLTENHPRCNRIKIEFIQMRWSEVWRGVCRGTGILPPGYEEAGRMPAGPTAGTAVPRFAFTTG